MRPGVAIRFRYDDGTEVTGQVWDEAPNGALWYALSDGRFARVTDRGHGTVHDALGRSLSLAGKVAA